MNKFRNEFSNYLRLKKLEHECKVHKMVLARWKLTVSEKDVLVSWSTAAGYIHS